jgi:hypothetical protein
MGIDLKALQELQQQLAQEDNNGIPKIYNIVRMERSATDVDDNWLYQPKCNSPVCDGYWIEDREEYCPLSISSITSFEDVETVFSDLCKYFDEDLKVNLKKPFDQIDDAEDFVYSLPDYVLERFRIIPFREYLRDSYPEAIFLTKASAEQFINSLDSNQKDNLVINCRDIQNHSQLKLLTDLVKNVDLKILAKALPKEQKR